MTKGGMSFEQLLASNFERTSSLQLNTGIINRTLKVLVFSNRTISLWRIGW
jgi:hypothetical protein